MKTTLRIPYFDNAEFPFDPNASANPPKPNTGLEQSEIAGLSKSPYSLDNFLKLTTSDRLKDSRHVYAYYLDYSKMAASFDMFVEGQKATPSSPEDIWRFVKPNQLWLEKQDGVEYVMCDCHCGWDPEHGVQLVWKEGRRLTKVSGFDGHPTNRRAPETMVYYGENYVTHLD